MDDERLGHETFKEPDSGECSGGSVGSIVCFEEVPGHIVAKLTGRLHQTTNLRALCLLGGVDPYQAMRNVVMSKMEEVGPMHSMYLDGMRRSVTASMSLLDIKRQQQEGRSPGQRLGAPPLGLLHEHGIHGVPLQGQSVIQQIGNPAVQKTQEAYKSSISNAKRRAHRDGHLGDVVEQVQRQDLDGCEGVEGQPSGAGQDRECVSERAGGGKLDVLDSVACARAFVSNSLGILIVICTL